MTGPADDPSSRDVSVRRWLRGSDRPLVSDHDVVLFDLDGTVYLGTRAIDGAPQTMAAVRDAGGRPVFVTNNASRSPETIAGQLTELGVTAAPSEIVTSAQAGADLLRDRLGPGRRVLVVGGEGIRAALAEAGMDAVDRADRSPEAILQGWAPELNWSMLAEGAYALAAAVPWIVTNVDATLPTAHGIAPGNGQFVDVLARTTNRRPDAVAGKPGPGLLRLALSRVPGDRPLVVGDRLDTDIAAAVAADVQSLLVLSGVTTPADLLGAADNVRPTFVAADLTGVLEAQPAPVPVDSGWACGGWFAEADHRRSTLTAHQVRTAPTAPIGAGDLDLLRAACAAAWSAADSGHPVEPDADLVGLLAAFARPVGGSAQHRP